MKYSICTGYWSGKGYNGTDDDSKAKFFENVWWPNTIKNSNPVDIFIINPDSNILPKKYGKWLDLSFNLGHVHDLDENNYYNKRFGGWSMSFILGAMTCYANDCDYLFKEQDCLTFGPWVDKMYEDLNKTRALMLVGRSQDADGQGLEQSLMLIKHEFILEFVTSYLSFNQNDSGPSFVRPEQKFKYLWSSKYGKLISEMSFGYGRARPKTYDEEVFYVQKLTPAELNLLDRKKLINLNG